MNYSVGDILYFRHNSEKVCITKYSNYIYHMDNGYGYLGYELDEYFVNLNNYPKLLNLMGKDELLKLLRR
jgi:hypothetical protein